MSYFPSKVAPSATLTVADLIEALSTLPDDAQVVVSDAAKSDFHNPVLLITDTTRGSRFLTQFTRSPQLVVITPEK